MTDHNSLPDRVGFIDLHTHTTESDGTYAPNELITAASEMGLAAIAITDHDTFGGYEKALAFSQGLRLQLVRGIELNSRLNMADTRMISVHVLAYFLGSDPSPAFLQWLSAQREERHQDDKGLRPEMRARIEQHRQHH